MYSSGSRRLSRSQQTQPPHNPNNAHSAQDMGMFMPGDPGGFVLPNGPQVSSTAPLGFVVPGAPQSHGWGNSAYPPMHALCAGEPGGFIVPNSSTVPGSYVPTGSYAPNSYQRPQSTMSSYQRPQSPAMSTYSQDHTRAPYHNAYSTMSSHTTNARNVPSRQGSVCSHYSTTSRRSGASSTMVNGHVYPKHSQHSQHSRHAQPAYTWDDFRYGH
ncbi:hypothetical protein IW139_005240 [Coemansia sp. RSA 353]|nr:hypothetical protein IW144_005607 [Coemansia sp. RSA 522]KAJ2199245.1 hypothetical protein IW145_005371 [Coemansia sp. RSA 521]KAJ2223040.1 hypothetical protein EV180_004127 [Coemansia sp. RSA 518]KAJ2266403.1 hypothetical protein J3F81_005490 [Coemansia sp. RSA 371]KAJ2269402.1 hypothetical protein GGH14_005478 [Coemansia sp. RSA 370]KAJ2285403.1 hypothetical protein IW141_005801 [Coemansia sp. RSA 355]KAJ2289141.1 hypothetical protein IW139_005240 [Coemansia sp. RSA 353]KAJ2593474.1 hyp